jgi:hypothetical protein
MDITETDVPLVLDAVSEEDIDNIVHCLEEIANVLKNADNLIVRNFYSLLCCF